VIDAFMQYLWSDEAQQAFVKFHFYSSTNDAFNQANTVSDISRCRSRSNTLVVGTRRIPK
jgi:ABC-type sulfate transport system substrate-binding protein